MPLIRSQLKSDPIMERLAAHSTFEFRTLAAFVWVCAVLGTGAMAIFGRGLPAWAAGCVSIVTATIGLYRFRKERMLLSDSETAVATVSQRTRAEGPDGGYFYSVRYRFFAPDGKVYLGSSGSTERELPEEGGTLPILYRRNDPNQNEALATFWVLSVHLRGNRIGRLRSQRRCRVVGENIAITLIDPANRLVSGQNGRTDGASLC